MDQNLAAIGDMYSIAGFSEALKMSTKLAQVDQVLKSVTGKEGQAFTIARSGELMGKFINPTTKQFDDTGFDKFLDLIVRSAIATHGKVTPDQWLAFAKQGNVAAGGMTEEGLMAQASTIQAMGGYRTGTAGQAMIRQMVGGVMAQRVAGELVRLGLLDANKLHIAKGGHVVIDQGGLVGGDLLQKDQLAYFHDIVMPAWEKHGIDTPEKQMKEYYQMFGTGPAQRLAFELIRGYPQITAERERMKGATGVGASLDALNKESPIAAKAAMGTAWDNMLTALGSETLRAAIPLMHGLTSVFNVIGDFAVAHPTALKIIGEGIAAIGAALVIGGAGAVLASFGAVGASIATIVAGVGAMTIAIVNFLPSWQKFLDAIKMVFNFPGTAIDSLRQHFFPGLWGGGSRSSAEPPASNSSGDKTGSVYMDGQKVGSIVTRHQVAAASGPSQGSAYFDPTMADITADFGFARG